MASSGWPQPLQPVTGPMRPAKIDGAARGMGDRGPATRSMVEAGLVPPDLLCGLTLFLLANQPRPARPPGATGSERKGAAGVSGGVWVRERFTVHRPLPTAEVFLVEGEAVGRHVRKGRRYGTTVSRTVDAAHRPVASNVTTGLLSYRPEAGLADGVDGQPADEVEVRGPDHGAAAENPHLDVLLAVRPGATFGGDELVVSLAMMAARDTDNPDNPIHSDLEEAKRAGLAKPIAGGSHVLSFAIEPLLAAWGPGALSHGAAFDVRWKAPTEADDAIVPTATVTSVDDGVIVVTVEVALAAGPVAMTGTVAVPVPTS